MKTVGLICAYNEAATISRAVGSLLDVGCDRVVVVDGHWSPEFGAAPYSTDGTEAAAVVAGAEWVRPAVTWDSDGGKRDTAVHVAGCRPGDQLFLLDADEVAVGSLEGAPAGHGCVLLRNLCPNDLPGIRRDWPRGDYAPVVPLLRWLRYSPGLSCTAPGKYREDGRPIRPYVLGTLEGLSPEEACELPLLPNVRVDHYGQPSPERVLAKRAYYEDRMQVAGG